MVLSCLRGEPVKELTGYIRKAHRSPLRPLRCDLTLALDKLFSEIKIQIPNPPLRERVRQDWISDKTWEAIDTRVTAHQEGAQKNIRRLRRQIRAGLRTDRKRWAEEAGHTIESLLASDPPLVKEARVRMQGWYMYASDRPPTLSPSSLARISLDTLTVKRAETYAHILLPGRPITIKVPPFHVMIISQGKRIFTRR